MGRSRNRVYLSGVAKKGILSHVRCTAVLYLVKWCLQMLYDFLCTNSNSEVTAFDLIGDEDFLWYWPVLAVEQSLHVSGRIS